MTTHGLTLGKYAPLHKGHQLVIETALAEMEHLTILIYDAPETTPIPLNIRANWLRQLYPQAEIIEVWDGPTEVGNTPEIQKMHEDYILHTLKISGITHFYSSEFYGAHMSQALGAVNRQVDPPRQQIPISATQIRANPYHYRDYLHPLVYRDLILKIALLGAPSTGKSTLAEALAHAYHTVWMPEYGREYWETHQQERRLTLAQLVEIAEGHREREEKLLLQAQHYLFCDTNALTTWHFSQYYHQAALPRLVELAQQSASRYDVVLLCATDIPYADTWDRSGEMNRRIFQKQIMAELHTRKIPYWLIEGDVAARVAQVQRILARITPYGNVLAGRMNF